jgi:hypothetical protein
MATIGEMREIFVKKGFSIQQLPPDELLVKSIDVVERYIQPNGDTDLVLNIKYIDEKGKENSELFSCNGRIREKSRIPPPPKEVPKPITFQPLPMREKFGFDSDAETVSYMKEAMSFLLKDRGYTEIERERECDAYFEKESRGIFINFAPRLDEEGFNRVKELIDLRVRYGSDHDYGLVVPAFQDSMGVSLLEQDRWLRKHGEFLSLHRIGVYAVNNKNPNQIFPFTVYPNPRKDRELARYFMYTVQQWPVMRSKYVESKVIK